MNSHKLWWDNHFSRITVMHSWVSTFRRVPARNARLEAKELVPPQLAVQLAARLPGRLLAATLKFKVWGVRENMWKQLKIALEVWRARSRLRRSWLLQGNSQPNQSINASFFAAVLRSTRFAHLCTALYSKCSQRIALCSRNVWP